MLEYTDEMKDKMAFFNERQQKITEMVDKSGSVRVADLSKQFSVSEETIRRDFEKLEAQGLINRIHGGAVRKEDQKSEIPIPKRKAKNMKEKEMIAMTAASYVKDGDIIAMDASTTTLIMTQYIKGKNLTVITNSIGVSLELAQESDIRVILIGGYLAESSMSLVGNFAERVIQDYHVDKFFFSCLGVDFKRGVSEIHEDQALVKKQLISISEKLFLLADHSKFGEKSLFRLCDVSQADYLITDNKVSINTIRELNNLGINGIVAEKSE
ncbi:DeoR/GlpR family DNA-binding transcription regulator [Sediminibacillus albus]|uniref:DNA-binding transcriptional regulator of sugar metabolism, DeoR/GlpR family n=1 Tax=Sediminibacillus albus TaxID=407036 RepID=A0A1G8YFU2_9BACI|nr:DeoR/GlpR family DNA-binding transcription regulator [Sediminibacillus albus]SDK01105.1 DNA-binding transcriptional regulator of sugar metabolism, DeoR/GlpR family [Sediminibacillus albus]